MTCEDCKANPLKICVRHWNTSNHEDDVDVDLERLRNVNHAQGTMVKSMAKEVDRLREENGKFRTALTEMEPLMNGLPELVALAKVADVLRAENADLCAARDVALGHIRHAIGWCVRGSPVMAKDKLDDAVAALATKEGA